MTLNYPRCNSNFFSHETYTQALFSFRKAYLQLAWQTKSLRQHIQLSKFRQRATQTALHRQPTVLSEHNLHPISSISWQSRHKRSVQSSNRDRTFTSKVIQPLCEIQLFVVYNLNQVRLLSGWDSTGTYSHASA